jgi:hypothetical protein
MISSSCGGRVRLFRIFLGGLGVSSWSSEQRSITFVEDGLQPDLRLRLGGGGLGSSSDVSSIGLAAVDMVKVVLGGQVRMYLLRRRWDEVCVSCGLAG